MKYDVVVNVDLVFVGVLALIALVIYAIVKAIRWIAEAKSDIILMCSPPRIEVNGISSMTSRVFDTSAEQVTASAMARKVDAEIELIRAQAANERRRLMPLKSECTGDSNDKTSS